jgi:hypothetical protein
VTVNVIAIVAGAGCAVAADVATRRTLPSRLVPAAAAGLVTAAVIYPAARVGREAMPGVAGPEWLAVAATTGVLAAASRRSSSPAVRAVVAGGWFAHAIFDRLHDRGPGSRLPSWYPAVCAGYDIATAGLLLRP